MGYSMMKFIVLSVLLNTGEIQAMLPEDTKIEASRKRGKGQRGRRRGGGGLRQMRVQVMNCVMEYIIRNNIYRGNQIWRLHHK